MVYFIENNKSINELYNEYNIHIDDIIHEYNMSILESKYNFICENGYEMPLNEAEEKKQGFFKKMITNIKMWLKRLCDKAVTKLNNFMKNHPDSKINGFITKIRDLFKKASNKLDNVSSPEEAKDIADDAKEEVKDTMEEAEEETSTNNIKLSKSFYNALENKKIRLIRIMMKDALLVDPSFKIYDKMVKETKSLEGLYDIHDGRELDYNKDNWNDDYLSLEMVRVIDNFSHERLNFIKKLVTYHVKNK